MPLAAAGGGFDDAVFEAGEEAGTMGAEPIENVGSEAAVVGSSFDELIADRRWEIGYGGPLTSSFVRSTMEDRPALFPSEGERGNRRPFHCEGRFSDRRWFFSPFEPLGELEGEEFAEEGAGADAGNIIAVAADAVSFLFIKSTIWTVKGQFHKAVERDNAAGAYLLCNDFPEIFQLLCRVVRI